MKKIISVLLSAVLFVGLSFTAVNAETAYDTAETIALVESINDLSALSQSYGAVTLHYEYYESDGIKSGMVSISEDKFYSYSKSGVIIYDVNGSVYCYIPEIADSYFSAVFASTDDYDGFVGTYELIPWYAPGSMDDTTYITDGNGYIEISYFRDFAEGDIADIANEYGLDATTLAGWCDVLKVSPETYEIQELTTYIRFDGNEDMAFLPYTHVRCCYGESGAVAPYSFEQFAATDNVRNITLVYEPGTESEGEYTITAPKGYPAMIYNMYYDMYDDAECTVPHMSSDFDEDAVIYLVSNGTYQAQE